jgi:hypothetical protein
LAIYKQDKKLREKSSKERTSRRDGDWKKFDMLCFEKLILILIFTGRFGLINN